jgi:hypothetical protein
LPLDNRGASIISYNIYFRSHNSNSNFVLLKTGQVTNSYTATLTGDNLIKGIYYDFQITSLNSVGESTTASPTCIGLVSTVPSTPTLPITIENNDSCVLSWTPSYNGGQNITMYYVMIQTGDGIQYI